MKILVTGATGCIGAATIHQLTLCDHVESVIAASRSADPARLKIWQPAGYDPRIEFIALDVNDANAVRTVIADSAPTQIIHLAALQSPACEADHMSGLQTNLASVLQLLDTIGDVAPNLQRLVFASSAAVYGPRSAYPGERVMETDRLLPPNHYGVWKVAAEHLVRLFHERTGVDCLSWRLNTTYGPGRDLGLTSAPTKGIKAVAESITQGVPVPFRMPYRGRENYHFVADVAAHFAQGAVQPFAGCEALNIKGQTMDVAEFLEFVRQVATEMGHGGLVDIGFEDEPDENLFVCDLDDRRVDQLFTALPRTPIADGVRQSLQYYTSV